jgi:chemotaxis protein CheD
MRAISQPDQRVRAPVQRIDIVLQPGEYTVADHRYRILTLLGSCVSITLWHAGLRIGAMSHFLVPSRTLRGPGPCHGAPLDAHYGDEALALMLRGLAARGVSPRACEAKVFGGGDMFPTLSAAGGVGVGRRNGDAARRLLESHGIEVRAGSLYGQGHRKIIFDIASGHVWSRHGKVAVPGEPNA